MKRANECLRQNPPVWPKLTFTFTPTECIVRGRSTYNLPLPTRLKSDTVNALLKEMIQPLTEEATLLASCELSYQAVDDWDGPGQIVAVVLLAPKEIYERLQNKKIYGNIISVMTTMVCENIGGDILQCQYDKTIS